MRRGIYNLGCGWCLVTNLVLWIVACSGELGRSQDPAVSDEGGSRLGEEAESTEGTSKKGRFIEGAMLLNPGAETAEDGVVNDTSQGAVQSDNTTQAGGGTTETDGNTAVRDPGLKGIHRLNNREYDSTLSDLLGTRVAIAGGFLNESAYGFDNNAATLGMTRAQYAAYFDAAGDVAEIALTDAPTKDQLLECGGDSEEGCAALQIESFGLRTWRRPLSEDEVTTLLGVYQRARELQLDHSQAMQQVVRALLASGEFLYRMEFDPEPNSDQIHPVSEYELASRLSYFLWSSMPDAQLFELAKRGELSDSAALMDQTQRLLNHERSSSLVDAFAWQWLGMKGLESHAVLSDAYPEWDEQLRASMLEEARRYLTEFLLEPSDWGEFLTAELQFVDARLASHYGQPAPSSDFERRVGMDDQRLGFMGLGAFLTVSSFAHRTSPTLRAKWVLEALMCSPPPPPPANVNIGDLDAEALANQAASIDNVRERLELHRSDPACAGCHAALDPLGLSLEHFDAIGRYRSQYDDGSDIDATGELQSGVQLDGLRSLAEYVQKQEAFWTCTIQKLMTYALGRALTTTDDVHVDDLFSQWKQEPTFQSLVQALVLSPPFLERRGGVVQGPGGVE